MKVVGIIGGWLARTNSQNLFMSSNIGILFEVAGYCQGSSHEHIPKIETMKFFDLKFVF
jgi:hypothetical protein